MGMARNNDTREPSRNADPQQTPAATNASLQDGAAPGPELISRRAYELYEEREREQERDHEEAETQTRR